jgi:hypothetical protein
MNQVLDWLYVGSIKDAENHERLREAGIEALLSLAYPAARASVVPPPLLLPCCTNWWAIRWRRPFAR